MLLFEGSRQDDDLARTARHQRKSILRSAHAGNRPKHRAKPPDFDFQPRAIRFIGGLRSECSRKEDVPWHFPEPRLAQRARATAKSSAAGASFLFFGVLGLGRRVIFDY
jgi:hypothetical protein